MNMPWPLLGPRSVLLLFRTEIVYEPLLGACYLYTAQRDGQLFWRTVQRSYTEVLLYDICSACFGPPKGPSTSSWCPCQANGHWKG